MYFYNICIFIYSSWVNCNESSISYSFWPITEPLHFWLFAAILKRVQLHLLPSIWPCLMGYDLWLSRDYRRQLDQVSEKRLSYKQIKQWDTWLVYEDSHWRTLSLNYKSCGSLKHPLPFLTKHDNINIPSFCNCLKSNKPQWNPNTFQIYLGLYVTALYSVYLLV